MEIWLTEGLNGRKTELIAAVDTAEEAREVVDFWKEEAAKGNQYRVEEYNRILGTDEGNTVAIDFGDHSWFISIEGCKFAEFTELIYE